MSDLSVLSSVASKSLAADLSASSGIAQLESDVSDDAAQSKLDALNAKLAILEQNRWVVTEAEVQTYQGLTSRMQFLTDDPLDAISEQYAQYYAQLSAGKITAKEFLQAIDDRVQMAVKEQESDLSH